jgi:CubicO group peptidase (beta-lactamase class C family)
MPYRYVEDGRFEPYGQYGYPDYPDGQLRTGAGHLARFLGAFIAFGTWDGERILSEESVREMRRRQFRHITRGQGLIWYYTRWDGDLLLGHNGGDSGVNTRMFFRPSDGTGVIVLANGDAWDGPLQDIQDRLFDVFGERRNAPSFSGDAGLDVAAPAPRRPGIGASTI